MGFRVRLINHSDLRIVTDAASFLLEGDLVRVLALNLALFET